MWKLTIKSIDKYGNSYTNYFNNWNELINYLDVHGNNYNNLITIKYISNV